MEQQKIQICKQGRMFEALKKEEVTLTPFISEDEDDSDACAMHIRRHI